MNAVEKLFAHIGYVATDKIDVSKISISKPAELAGLNDMINTQVVVESNISQVIINYERIDIGSLIKFSFSALEQIGRNKEQFQRYVREFYDVELELADFEIVKNEVIINPLCYLYVGKAKLKAHTESIQFKVNYDDYCKIGTILQENNNSILYETLTVAIEDFKSLDVGNVNELFSFNIKDDYIELTLMDHTKIILSMEL